jgi:putative peptidoglycan lipid II flippase
MNEMPRMEKSHVELRAMQRMASFLIGGAVFGKILGFARELLAAAVFGASAIADSFRAGVTAVGLPLLPMEVETVPAVLVPLHQELQRKRIAAKVFAALVLALTLVAVGLMMIIQWLGPLWIRLIVGGMSQESQDLTLAMVRIMAFYMPASVMLNCLAAIEIATGRSRIYGLQAIILSVSLILAILIYIPTQNILYLPAAFVLAHVVFAIWNANRLWRAGLLDPKGISFKLMRYSIVAFWRRFRPVVIQPIVLAIAIAVEKFAASGIGVGILSSLSYARTLSDSALLVIAQPIGWALMSGGWSEATAIRARKITKLMVAAGVPFSLFIFVFAETLTRMVFARGAFDDAAVQLTAHALKGISVGIWAGAIGVVLMRVLYVSNRSGLGAAIFAVAQLIWIAGNMGVYFAELKLVDGALWLGMTESLKCLIIFGACVVALDMIRPTLLACLACVPGTLLMYAISLSILGAGYAQWLTLLLGGLVCALTVIGCLFAVDYRLLIEIRNGLLSRRIGKAAM